MAKDKIDTDKLEITERESQQALMTAGQRRINVIWEVTQAVIAVMITGSVVYCVVNGIKGDILYNAFFLIVSIYFVRTNHQRIGGVGYKDLSEGR